MLPYSTFPVYCNTVKVIELPLVMVIVPYPALGSPRELNVIDPGYALRLIPPRKISPKILVSVPPPSFGKVYCVELLNVRVCAACLAMARACTDRMSDFIMSAAVSNEISVVGYFDMTTNARIPIVIITMIISIRVNPRSFFIIIIFAQGRTDVNRSCLDTQLHFFLYESDK